MLKEHQLANLRSLKGIDRQNYKALICAHAYGKEGALRDLALFEPKLSGFPLTPQQCYPKNYKLLLL